MNRASTVSISDYRPLTIVRVLVNNVATSTAQITDSCQVHRGRSTVKISQMVLIRFLTMGETCKAIF